MTERREKGSSLPHLNNSESPKHSLFRTPSLSKMNINALKPESNNNETNTKHISTMTNYFGLPSTAYASSVDVIVQKCRGIKTDGTVLITKDVVNDTIKIDDFDDNQSDTSEICDKDGLIILNQKNFINNQSSSQLKIADSILNMTRNVSLNNMTVVQGICAAVFKLIKESDSSEVINTCLLCLNLITKDPISFKLIVDMSFISLISIILTHADDDSKILLAMILCNITSTNDDSVLYTIVTSGGTSAIHSMIAASEETTTLQLIMCCINNLSFFLTGNNAHTGFKSFLTASRKLPLVNNIAHAYMTLRFFRNLSSFNHFSGIMCEYSGVSYILSIAHLYPSIVSYNYLCEIIMNVSMHKKNVRLV